MESNASPALAPNQQALREEQMRYQGQLNALRDEITRSTNQSIAQIVQHVEQRANDTRATLHGDAQSIQDEIQQASAWGASNNDAQRSAALSSLDDAQQRTTALGATVRTQVEWSKSEAVSLVNNLRQSIASQEANLNQQSANRAAGTLLPASVASLANYSAAKQRLNALPSWSVQAQGPVLSDLQSTQQGLQAKINDVRRAVLARNARL